MDQVSLETRNQERRQTIVNLIVFSLLIFSIVLAIAFAIVLRARFPAEVSHIGKWAIGAVLLACGLIGSLRFGVLLERKHLRLPPA